MACSHPQLGNAVCPHPCTAAIVCMHADWGGGVAQVLTVNQTVGILVKYWSCRDWQAAVTGVVPTRKAD